MPNVEFLSDVFKAVGICTSAKYAQGEVFWVVIGYQRFGGPCCLHLQGKAYTALGLLDSLYVIDMP